MLELQQQRCVGGVVVFNGRSASPLVGAEQTQTHSHKPITHLASNLEYVQGKREVPPLPDKPPERVATRKVTWPGKLFSVALDLSRSQQRARWSLLRHEALPN